MQSGGRNQRADQGWQRALLVVGVAAGALLGIAAVARGDDATDPITRFLDGTAVHGEVEAGGEPRSVDGRSGKFDEYRDIPDNAVFNDGKLSVENEERGYFVDVRVEDAIQDDQRYQLRMGKYGLYEIEVEWDQIPHVFSTTGRSLFAGDDGQFTMAQGIREILSTNPALLPQVLDAAHPVSLATRLDTGRFRVRYTPRPQWEMRLGYAVERNRGARPLDTASFTSLTDGAPSPFLASIVELPSPVDSLTHSVESSIEYQGGDWFLGRDWFLRLGETSSFFEDQLTTMTWDNPFQLTDQVGAGSQGRLTLAPSNQAHTINLSGGTTLPLRSRLTGTFAYGWMLQDDDFVPATINTALSVAPLPRGSYDGNIQTILANVLLSSRPHDAVTVNSRYHLYDLENNSPMLTFTDYAIDDAVLGIQRTSVPYAYSRQSIGADVVVRPLPLASMKVGYEWGFWHRKHREVQNSNEYKVGPSVDLTPMRGLLVRVEYTHANRDPKDYNPYAASETGAPNLFNPLLRKFDEAEVDRDQVATLVSLTSPQRVSVTGTFTYAADDYSQSAFGLQDDDTLTFSIHVAATPHERVTVYGDYAHEDHRFHQAVGFGPLGKDGFRGRGHDTYDTPGAGCQVAVLPGKLDLDVNYSLGLGTGRLHATTAADETADFPNVNTTLHQLTVLWSYKLTKHLTAKLGYAFERYETNDFASQVVQPDMASTDGPKDSIRPPSLFLGARDPDGDYTANVGTIALRYEF